MTNRERITGSIEIDAPPSAVWTVVSDLKRMGEWSPQCRRMIVRGGEVREGTTTLNINRQGMLFWPTRSKVKELVPNERLSFRVLENGTIWTFELEETERGTKLLESRTAPHGVKKVSNVLTQRVLGGTDEFERNLETGILQTLQRIKAEVEGGA